MNSGRNAVSRRPKLTLASVRKRDLDFRGIDRVQIRRAAGLFTNLERFVETVIARGHEERIRGAVIPSAIRIFTEERLSSGSSARRRDVLDVLLPQLAVVKQKQTRPGAASPLR